MHAELKPRPHATFDRVYLDGIVYAGMHCVLRLRLTWVYRVDGVDVAWWPFIIFSLKLSPFSSKISLGAFCYTLSRAIRDAHLNNVSA